MEQDLTILISTYNRPEKLLRLLRILKDQTCQSFVIWILDESPDVYGAKLAEQITGEGFESTRITSFKCRDNNDWGQQNKDLFAKRAVTPYLSFMNDDSMYDLRYVETMLQEAHRTRADIIACDFKHESLGIVETYPAIGRIDIGNFIMNRQLFLNIDGFTDFGPCGDGVLICKAMVNGARFIRVPLVLNIHEK